MKIFKYRKRWASGPEEWSFVDPVDVGDINKFRDDLADEFCWSDTYRGCDIEIVDASDAPLSYIEGLIEKQENIIKYTQIRLGKLQDEYQKRISAKYEKSDSTP